MQNRRFAYPATIREEDGEWLVSFRDIPECITAGDSLAEARAAAIDALDESLAGAINRREAFPEPSAALRDEYLVAPTIGIALKAAIVEAMQAETISGAELAARLGCDRKEVSSRILDPRHATKVARLEEALTAIGREVQIEIVDISKRTRMLGRPGAVKPVTIETAETPAITRRG